MLKSIPEFLEEILKNDYGEDIKNKIINGYLEEKVVTLRINTLKTSIEEVKLKLKDENISYKEVSWNKSALIVENVREDEIKSLSIYENGEIYLQSLSSMIPVLVLAPKPNENILDMAAAPGGKTTQIVAITQNEAMITACEKNKIRGERLKYNLEKQGCTSVNVMLQDARRLDNMFSFDKILLDSPCSGSGTDNIFKDNFTKELITKIKKTQEELLKKAISILKTGHEMVYSTCSILKQENEGILNMVLKGLKCEIIPIDEEIFKDIPMLPTKISGTICVAPNKFYEGFFVAKIRKK